MAGVVCVLQRQEGPQGRSGVQNINKQPLMDLHRDSSSLAFVLSVRVESAPKLQTLSAKLVSKI